MPTSSKSKPKVKSRKVVKSSSVRPYLGALAERSGWIKFPQPILGFIPESRRDPRVKEYERKVHQAQLNRRKLVKNTMNIHKKAASMGKIKSAKKQVYNKHALPPNIRRMINRYL